MDHWAGVGSSFKLEEPELRSCCRVGEGGGLREQFDTLDPRSTLNLDFGATMLRVAVAVVLATGAAAQAVEKKCWVRLPSGCAKLMRGSVPNWGACTSSLECVSPDNFCRVGDARCLTDADCDWCVLAFRYYHIRVFVVLFGSSLMCGMYVCPLAPAFVGPPVRPGRTETTAPNATARRCPTR